MLKFFIIPFIFFHTLSFAEQNLFKNSDNFYICENNCIPHLQFFVEKNPNLIQKYLIESHVNESCKQSIQNGFTILSHPPKFNVLKYTNFSTIKKNNFYITVTYYREDTKLILEHSCFIKKYKNKFIVYKEQISFI